LKWCRDGKNLAEMKSMENCPAAAAVEPARFNSRKHLRNKLH